jgi:hypothetical protein
MKRPGYLPITRVAEGKESVTFLGVIRGGASSEVTNKLAGVFSSIKRAFRV